MKKVVFVAVLCLMIAALSLPASARGITADTVDAAVANAEKAYYADAGVSQSLSLDGKSHEAVEKRVDIYTIGYELGQEEGCLAFFLALDAGQSLRDMASKTGEQYALVNHRQDGLSTAIIDAAGQIAQIYLGSKGVEYLIDASRLDGTSSGRSLLDTQLDADSIQAYHVQIPWYASVILFTDGAHEYVYPTQLRSSDLTPYQLYTAEEMIADIQKNMGNIVAAPLGYTETPVDGNIEDNPNTGGGMPAQETPSAPRVRQLCLLLALLAAPILVRKRKKQN